MKQLLNKDGEVIALLNFKKGSEDLKRNIGATGLLSHRCLLVHNTKVSVDLCIEIDAI